MLVADGIRDVTTARLSDRAQFAAGHQSFRFNHAMPDTFRENPPHVGPEESVVYVVDGDPETERILAPIAASASARTSLFRSPETFLYSFQDRPGCIVIDIEHCLAQSINLPVELPQRGCRNPILLVGANPPVDAVVNAMEFGAVTLLRKPFDEERTQRYVTEAILNDREQRQKLAASRAVVERFNRLTSKELEVIERILNGSTNREIAADLGISVRAVEDRRSRIMRRMEAASLVQLVDLVREAQSFSAS